MCPGLVPYARAVRDWLLAKAEQARSNVDLARRFIARCRETMTILPAITTIERLCADALVAAERRIEKRIAARLDPVACDGLDRLTTEMQPGAISRFIRSEEHTSELQSLMRISYAVFCLKKKK